MCSVRLWLKGLAVATSIRMNALTQTVAVLAAVNGAGSYLVDLSKPGQVSLTQDPMEVRRSKPYDTSVRVRDGQETVERVFQNTQNAEATLEVVLELVVVSRDDDGIVLMLNDLLHDVSLALGAKRTLNGVVADSFVQRVAAPVYDSKDHTAACVVVLVVVYDFLQGTTI